MEKKLFTGYMLKPFGGFMAYETDVARAKGGPIEGFNLYRTLREAEYAKEDLPLRIARNMEIIPIELVSKKEEKVPSTHVSEKDSVEEGTV